MKSNRKISIDIHRRELQMLVDKVDKSHRYELMRAFLAALTIVEETKEPVELNILVRHEDV